MSDAKRRGGPSSWVGRNISRNLEATSGKSTASWRTYLPVTDIFETDQALIVVLEMPGVGKDAVDVSVENDILTINGQIDYSEYGGLQPIYTEYNVGH